MPDGLMDKTALTYWFPKLEVIGLPVPKTILLPMSAEAYRDVFNAFDGLEMNGSAHAFALKVKEAANKLGYPCFLRTAHTSGKHDWERTCYIPDSKKILSHIINIVEYSELTQIMGLPCDWWAVREFLPTKPLTTCPKYGNMPVCKEFRVFVKNDKIHCWHPYWPSYALEQGGASISQAIYENLSRCQDTELTQLLLLASRAGQTVGGAWSIDILDTERGWYITDMAESEKSFHWEGCE